MRGALCIVAVLAGLALPTVAKAATINGGFEDGFTDWEAVGDYRVETSTFGSEPVEGTSQVFYQQPLMKYLFQINHLRGMQFPSLSSVACLVI